MEAWGAGFLLFIFCFHWILNMFSNSSSFYPIFFVVSSTLENPYM
jgi:hypothetical protein